MADKKAAAPAAQNAGEKPVLKTKVITSKVRFSYVHVWRPVAMTDKAGNVVGKPKYSASLLIPKTDTELVAKIEAAIAEAIEQGKTVKFGGKVPANLKRPLRDGDTEREDNPEYAGHYFITASSETKPGILDRAKQPILVESDFYSGVYGRASINFYAFNTNGNKGIACGLNHVQKLEDGEPLGGRGRAEDDFDDLEDEDTDLMG